MPTQTFNNLPAEKRATFVAIALEEFAANDYAATSIDRIVARAGIAKGSVYQYFAGKQDLYLHLVDYASQTLLGFVGDDGPPDAGDIFAVLRWQMQATVRAALAHPLHARLIQRAYSSPLPFQEALIRQGRATGEHYFRQLVERGITRGDIDPSIDPAVAAAVIRAITSEIGPLLMQGSGLEMQQAADLDARRFLTPAVQHTFDQVVRIMEYGLRSAHDRQSNP